MGALPVDLRGGRARRRARPHRARRPPFLRIAETPAGFSYFASPGGQAPVEFRLKELADKRVVFENAAHDFPQRILYWRDGDALVARIEGTIRGEARQQEWRFARQR